VLNLAQCQTCASFRPYCIALPLFWRFRVVRQCRNVYGTDFDLEGVKILAKIMQNGKKKRIFGTGLNLALLPAKCYECPSLFITSILIISGLTISNGTQTTMQLAFQRYANYGLRNFTTAKSNITQTFLDLILFLRLFYTMGINYEQSEV